MSIPSFTVDLLKELNLLYPDKCPEMTMSDREVWFKAGQRSVVNRLNYLQAQDQDGLPNVLNQDTL